MKNKNMVDVSIIIVNYNTSALTTQCISSIYASKITVSYEIILVDNASIDNTVNVVQNRFPDVRIIKNKENFGFGKANNIGAQQANGEYLFLLNSDTILSSDIITPMLHFLSLNVDVAACGCNLTNGAGKPAVSYGHFPTYTQVFSDIGFYKLYKNYYKKKLSIALKVEEKDVFYVDYICGADILIRKNIFDKLAGFDEIFFMYYEETDLFYRLKEFGFKSAILPYLSLTHLEGGSMEKLKFNMRKFKIYYKSRVIYFKKRRKWIPLLKLMDSFYYTAHIRVIGKEWYKIMYNIMIS